MSNSDRGAAIARRKARVIEYINKGLTVAEICDREGLDTENEPRRLRKEIAGPAGLTLTLGRNPNPPLGLTDIERRIRQNLGDLVNKLRRDNHFIDVAQMIGLTNIEQQRAMDMANPAHNWTISQIQRLGVACGKSFEEMLTEMNKPHLADMRNVKL